MRVSYLAGVVPLLSLAAAGLIARGAATTACNRDNVFRCILGASATGSAYCSSFLSYGTVTSYTSTVTPTVTNSVSTTTSATTTSTNTDTATTTVIDDFTVTSIDSVTATDTVLTTTTTTTTITAIPPLIPKRDAGAVRIYSEIYGNTALPRNIEARATTSPAPACLAQYTPASSRIQSACSCLTNSFSLSSATIYTVLTVPTVTVTNVNTISTTETDLATTTGTVTVDASTTETDLATTTITDLVSSTTTTAIISTVTQKCADCYLCTSNSQCQAGFECALYIGFDFGQVSLCSNTVPGAKDYTCSGICTN